MESVQVNAKMFHGYFKIHNVHISDGYFVDIWLQTYNLTELEFLRLEAYHDNDHYTSQLEWEEVKDAVNGQARLIYFTAKNTTESGKYDPTQPTYNSFNELREGNFGNGELDGFGRNMFIASDYSLRSKYGMFSNSDMNGKGILYTYTAMLRTI